MSPGSLLTIRKNTQRPEKQRDEFIYLARASFTPPNALAVIGVLRYCSLGAIVARAKLTYCMSSDVRGTLPRLSGERYRSLSR
jgi:hypothetical protein